MCNTATVDSGKLAQLPQNLEDLPPYEVWMRCTRKRRFETKKQARKYRHDLEKEIGETLVPYACDLCQGWHVGHPRGSRKNYERAFRAAQTYGTLRHNLMKKQKDEQRRWEEEHQQKQGVGGVGSDVP